MVVNGELEEVGVVLFGSSIMSRLFWLGIVMKTMLLCDCLRIECTFPCHFYFQ